MKKVITYGTFDLLHQGHLNLLKRAKELGDYLVVGVTSDYYDQSRGKLNVKETLVQRIENVNQTGLADMVIIEDYEGQKINDIQQYNIDVFAIGSDWLGKFDYLKEYCEVVYFERTKGISSTKIRNSRNGIIKLGIIGHGRIAKRFVSESKYVSGVNIEGVLGRNESSLKEFADSQELDFYTTNINDFLDRVDAVYIASPHLTHITYIEKALKNRKHVLCEKPMTLSKIEAERSFDYARRNKLVLMEAIKTAYCPAFIRLLSLVKTGVIGEVKSVDATFTKLIKEPSRELNKSMAGGSVTELSSYPLLAIFKVLGLGYRNVEFNTFFDENQIDLYTEIFVKYNSAVATAKVGIGVKSEGDLRISGTKGYIYVPAPWWKTEFFEVKYEEPKLNRKYFYGFEEDGLRYELAEFIRMINNKNYENFKLSSAESIAISGIIELFRKNVNVTYL